MNQIALVQKRSIVREGIVKIIEDNIPNTEVTSYDLNAFRKFIGNDVMLPNILIVDFSAVADRLGLLDYYISKDVKVIVWFHEGNEYPLQGLFRRNIYGYFSEGMMSKELVVGVRTIINGMYYIHPSLIIGIERDRV